ncbi:MAG: DUF4179 domain-containing protein [Chloroflexi bacterium]|nr:MAG: DUF4179 domain-containing protein [Chloroflexota bacterium]TMD82353.1 MAG: DUF4179 domain-containing protein [Chloroflexota bacterium]
MSKTLEDRLIRLEIPLPAALVPRVLSAAASKRSPVARRRLRLTVTLAMMLLVGAFVASLYAAPRFADALAGAPVIGGPTAALLRSVGLAPYAKQFTTINEVAVSSGYQVELVAAYADATQTILIFRSSPQADVFPGIQWPSSLTDQFGRNIEIRSGAYDSLVGAEVMQFEGLPWPDGPLGARLTAHIVALQPDPTTQTFVRGNWTLHATVSVEPGINIRPLPSDGVIASTTFRFTSIVRSGPSLEVDMSVQGPLAAHLTDAVGEAIPNVSKPHPVFEIRLLDSSGAEVQELRSEMHSGLGSESLRSLWLVTAPGRYHVVASYEGVGQFEREISVR